MAVHRGPVPVTQHRDATKTVLDILSERPTLHSNKDLAGFSQIDVKAALDRLASRSMVTYQTVDSEVVVLTKEGQIIVDEGSHEWKVWDVVKRGGRVAINDLPDLASNADVKVGQGNAFRNKWIRKDGDCLVSLLDQVQDTTRQTLQKIATELEGTDPKVLADLKRRRLITTTKVFTYTAERGPKYAREIPVEHTDLTADMLLDGSWQTATFKPYNFNALGASQSAGALHPLMKVRAEFRNIFFNQGFVEMPTSRFVDSGFWNFDSLFVPQQHPARDMHDTFFISDPASADPPREDPVAEQQMNDMEEGGRHLYATADAERQMKPRDYEQYWNDVKAVHQDGAFGSIGYRYPWSKDECLKLVLRTHTTAISAWVLHRLAEDPRPARYFSIDRVFRNESVDATHLAEFHQIEGVIADFGLTLGGLQKFLEAFFAQIGIVGLRFKPAYNPYTEPSMEIFGYHRGLGKWVEIGNSGMFRPEMLLPMGLPENLRVYGFGLSLERPTMIKYGVSNIRDLLGHKVDLSFIENNAAVRLDKA